MFGGFFVQVNLKFFFPRELEANWGIPCLLQHHYIFQPSLPMQSHFKSFFPDLLLHHFPSTASTPQVGVTYRFNKHILDVPLFGSETLITLPYYSFVNGFLPTYNNFFCWSQNIWHLLPVLYPQELLLYERWKLNRFDTFCSWQIYVYYLSSPSFFLVCVGELTGIFSDCFQ